MSDEAVRSEKASNEPRRDDPPRRTGAAAPKPQNRRDAARKMRAMFKGRTP